MFWALPSFQTSACRSRLLADPRELVARTSPSKVERLSFVPDEDPFEEARHLLKVWWRAALNTQLDADTNFLHCQGVPMLR